MQSGPLRNETIQMNKINFGKRVVNISILSFSADLSRVFGLDEVGIHIVMLEVWVSLSALPWLHVIFTSQKIKGGSCDVHSTAT